MKTVDYDIQNKTKSGEVWFTYLRGYIYKFHAIRVMKKLKKSNATLEWRVVKVTKEPI